MSVSNQQYLGKIGRFYNKLRVIKCYYNFLDFQKSYSAKIFDLGRLLTVCIIFQCTRIVNVYTLTSSYIFQVLVFPSYNYFYSRLLELNGYVGKNPGPKSKLDQSFPICHWNLIVSLRIFFHSPISNCI